MFNRTFTVLIALGVGLDQLSKWMARVFLSPVDPSVLTPFLQFQLVFNRGAAYGVFSGQAFFLLSISLLVIYWLVFYQDQFGTSKWLRYSAVFLMIGAIGNGIDRLMVGAVTDFIDIHIFPLFNLADISINIGVLCLIQDSFNLEFKFLKRK